MKFNSLPVELDCTSWLSFPEWRIAGVMMRGQIRSALAQRLPVLSLTRDQFSGESSCRVTGRSSSLMEKVPAKNQPRTETFFQNQGMGHLGNKPSNSSQAPPINSSIITWWVNLSQSHPGHFSLILDPWWLSISHKACLLFKQLSSGIICYAAIVTGTWWRGKNPLKQWEERMKTNREMLSRIILF